MNQHASEASRATPLTAVVVERWLGELGIEPIERAEREGVASWDVLLDGRRRERIRFTVILDPEVALVVWVQFAPPINDAFRKSYRRLLRWNDEFPFVKFAVSEDERPILTAELPLGRIDRDELGLSLARLVALCDRLLDDARDWLATEPKPAPGANRATSGLPLLERYAEGIRELVGAEDASEAQSIEAARGQETAAPAAEHPGEGSARQLPAAR